MRKQDISIALSVCFIALGAAAHAQSKKAGLWEVKAITKIQKPGKQAGIFSQTNGSNASLKDATPLASCYTQKMIDTYGILLPPSLRDCQLSNTVRESNRISADLVCQGRTNGSGSVETNWSDEDHAASIMHFVAKEKQGPNTMAMSWTQEASAVFKSSDCGAVKPRALPSDK